MGQPVQQSQSDQLSQLVEKPLQSKRLQALRDQYRKNTNKPDKQKTRNYGNMISDAAGITADLFASSLTYRHF